MLVVTNGSVYVYIGAIVVTGMAQADVSRILFTP